MKLRNKKTGETVDIDTFKIETPLLKYEIESLEELNNIIKELNGEWEDYEPKEPLIKDEKIRKELSEWTALYGEHEKIKYYEYNDFVVFRLSRKRGTPEPEIDIPTSYECDSLREGKEYTLAELCGEEQECES